MDMEQETDAGLMNLMGAAGPTAEDQTMAREALKELHRRYYPYVLVVCETFSESVGTVVIDPEGFAAATFEKAFRSAESFCDKSDGNPERAKLQVKSWLGVIATNLARDALSQLKRRKVHIEFVPLDETHDIEETESESNDTVSTPPPLLSALHEVLDALKPEEKDILITYATFGIPTKTGRELPKADREALEERTGYERSNIRQKWLRLSLKLKEKLEPSFINQKSSNQ